MPGKDLIKLYCSLVRLILEYGSVTYHYLITKAQQNSLENVQKRCLKCIFGHNFLYAELLSKLGLSTLKDCRKVAVLKFAKKTANNLVYCLWFIKNNVPSTSRPSKHCRENFSRTHRLYDNPIYVMRRLLNKTLPDIPDLTN